MNTMIGWVRDARGRVIDRPLKDISNAITATAGGNTTPYVLEIWRY